MPCFGQKYKDTDKEFRWPTLEDLQGLDLKKPPTLKEIVTRDSGYLLVSIQLKFEDDIESPLLGANNNNKAQESYVTKDKAISSVTVRVEGSCLRHLKVKYQDGATDNITKL